MNVASTGMPAKTIAITVGACLKIVDAATQTCREPTIQQAAQANPKWDAIAVALTSQSNSIAFGSVVLAVTLAVAGLGWGYVVNLKARDEARKIAESEVKKWLQDEGFPYVRRQVDEWNKSFPLESPISDDMTKKMVAAAGADGKEDGDGKE